MVKSGRVHSCCMVHTGSTAEHREHAAAGAGAGAGAAVSYHMWLAAGGGSAPPASGPAICRTPRMRNGEQTGARSVSGTPTSRRRGDGAGGRGRPLRPPTEEGAAEGADTRSPKSRPSVILQR